MNYTDFFSIISNQCGRLAPDLNVPEEFERVAKELSRMNTAMDLDHALVEPFRDKAGPKYEKLLWDIYQVVREPLAARIEELDQARLAIERERAENLRVAQANQEAAMRQLQADREALALAQERIAALENHVEELRKLR